MKTLQLNIDDNFYESLLVMLKGLSKQNIEIIEIVPEITAKKEKPSDVKQFSKVIDCFKEIADPVAWQKEIRSEWNRDWE